MTDTIIILCVGIILILTQFVRAPARPYLLLLGLAALVLAPSFLLPSPYQWIVRLVALLPIILAIREMQLEMRERLQHLREETRERERAFGDYLRATLSDHPDEDNHKQTK